MKVAYVEEIVTQSQRRTLPQVVVPIQIVVLLQSCYVPLFGAAQDPNLEFSLLQLAIR